MSDEISITDAQPMSLTAREELDQAQMLSTVLIDMVKATNGIATISGKKYLKVEAWQFIGEKRNLSPSWCSLMSGRMVTS